MNKSQELKAKRRVAKHASKAGLTSGVVGEGDSLRSISGDLDLAQRAQSEGWATPQPIRDKVKEFRANVVQIANDHALEVIDNKADVNDKLLSIGVKAGDSAMKGDQGPSGNKVNIQNNNAITVEFDPSFFGRVIDETPAPQAIEPSDADS